VRKRAILRVAAHPVYMSRVVEPSRKARQSKGANLEIGRYRPRLFVSHFPLSFLLSLSLTFLWNEIALTVFIARSTFTRTLANAPVAHVPLNYNARSKRAMIVLSPAIRLTHVHQDASHRGVINSADASQSCGF